MSPRREPPAKVEMREVAAAAIRAARNRAGLDQARLARRMTNIGWSWRRQTVGAVEAAERRVAVEELLPLSLALECSISDLISPVDPAHRGKVVVVDHEQDRYVPADDVSESVGAGTPTTFLKWVGDEPHWVVRTIVDDFARQQWSKAAAVRRAARGDARHNGAIMSSDEMADGIDAFVDGFLGRVAAALDVPRADLPGLAEIAAARADVMRDQLGEETQ